MMSAHRLAALAACLAGTIALGGCVAGEPADVAPGPTPVTESDDPTVDTDPGTTARMGRAAWLRAQLHQGQTLAEIRAYYPTAGLEVPPSSLTTDGHARQQTGIPRAEMADELDAEDLERFDHVLGAMADRTAGADGHARQQTGIPRAEMADELDAEDLERFDRVGATAGRTARPGDRDGAG